MNRRQVLAILGGVLFVGAIPRARAQNAANVRRIGWLTPSVRPTGDELEQQVAPLRELGWIEGYNLLIERRYTNSRPELLKPLAEELVRLEVELIVTEGTDATLAARNATRTIPIVIRSAGDPVRIGLVASLARPGGNITGYSIVGPETSAKAVTLLRELLPDLQRVGVLGNSASPYHHAMREDFDQACRSIGVDPVFVEVTAPSELVPAVAEVVRQRAQALIVENDRLFADNAADISSAAGKYHLPIEGDFLEEGALISYNFSLPELRRRGAVFIDKILRGARPADLPIEQPTQFELGINLKAAKALGIVVPGSLLVRADRVVQ